MSLKLHLTLAGCLAMSISCSKNGPHALVAASNAISESTTLVAASASQLQALGPSSVPFLPSALTVGTWWDDASIAGICDERVDGCATYLSGSEFMDIVTDPDVERENGSSITVFGRIKSGLAIMCAFSEALPASAYTGNYPNDGDYLVTFTAADADRVVRICDLDIDAGEQVSLTVSSTADTTYFDKKVNICFDGTGACASPVQTFLFRKSATEINIATSEDHERVPNFFSRQLISLNLVTDTLLAEYVSGFVGSGAPVGVEENVLVQRVIKIGDEAMMLSTQNSSAGGVAYMLKGNVVVDGPVELAYHNTSNVPYDTGTFSGGVYDPSAAISASTEFVSNTALITALYGDTAYDSANYFGVKEDSAPNFTSFATLRTAALIDSTP